MKSDTFTSPIKVPALKSGNPEIGMAPLIDVVFLLLIFFMVTTVFPENRGFIIEKPQSEQRGLWGLPGRHGWSGQKRFRVLRHLWMYGFVQSN